MENNFNLKYNDGKKQLTMDDVMSIEKKVDEFIANLKQADEEMNIN